MSKQITRRPTKHSRRQDRQEEQLRREMEQKQAMRTRRITLASIIGGVVVLAAIFTILAIVNGQAQTKAQTIVDPANPPIAYNNNNVYCDKQEQTAFHIHAHLSIYINGKPATVPQNMGIATDGQCFYWLHTHDTTGVIHIEAPANHSFVLGNFLKEWSDQFSQMNYPAELDLNGWQAYVDGKPYSGDFHNIPLQAHALITLAYNSPGVQPDTTYSWGTL